MIEAFKKLKELEGLVTGMKDQLVYTSWEMAGIVPS